MSGLIATSAGLLVVARVPTPTFTRPPPSGKIQRFQLRTQRAEELGAGGDAGGAPAEGTAP